MVLAKQRAKTTPQVVHQPPVDAVIRLTDEGIKKYRMITFNRPKVDRKVGQDYYFHWPLPQLAEYFKRFGKDAIVLQPDALKESLATFYRSAYMNYR